MNNDTVTTKIKQVKDRLETVCELDPILYPNVGPYKKDVSYLLDLIEKKDRALEIANEFIDNDCACKCIPNCARCSWCQTRINIEALK